MSAKKWLLMLHEEEVLEAFCTDIIPEKPKVEIPAAITEDDLKRLCNKYKYVIGVRIISTPISNIRIHYVIDQGRFNYLTSVISFSLAIICIYGRDIRSLPKTTTRMSLKAISAMNVTGVVIITGQYSPESKRRIAIQTVIESIPVMYLTYMANIQTVRWPSERLEKILKIRRHNMLLFLITITSPRR